MTIRGAIARVTGAGFVGIGNGLFLRVGTGTGKPGKPKRQRPPKRKITGKGKL